VKKRLHFLSRIGIAQMSKLDPFESSPVAEIDMKEKCIKVEVEI